MHKQTYDLCFCPAPHKLKPEKEVNGLSKSAAGGKQAQEITMRVVLDLRMLLSSPLLTEEGKR